MCPYITGLGPSGPRSLYNSCYLIVILLKGGLGGPLLVKYLLTLAISDVNVLVGRLFVNNGPFGALIVNVHAGR